MDPDRSDADLLRRERRNRHLLLLSGLVALILVNFVAGVVVPYAEYAFQTQPAWEQGNEESGCDESDPAMRCVQPMPQEQVGSNLLKTFGNHIVRSFLGVYLVVPAMSFATTGEMRFFPWQPFVWLGSVALAPLVVRFGAPIHVYARAAYAAALTLAASGFLAYYWPPISV